MRWFDGFLHVLVIIGFKIYILYSEMKEKKFMHVELHILIMLVGNFLTSFYPSYRKVRPVLRRSRKSHFCTALGWKTAHAVPAKEVFQVSLRDKGTSYYWATDSLRVWEAGNLLKG